LVYSLLCHDVDDLAQEVAQSLIAKQSRHELFKTFFQHAKEGRAMAELAVLDRAFDTVMKRIIQTGQAPHYTELAAAMGLDMESGKHLLHDLINSGIPAWLHPDTDYIVSFAPFHNLPTQYRVSVDGEQKWFAQ
jgi:hypothetical protein